MFARASICCSVSRALTCSMSRLWNAAWQASAPSALSVQLHGDLALVGAVAQAQKEAFLFQGLYRDGQGAGCDPQAGRELAHGFGPLAVLHRLQHVHLADGKVL